MTGDKGANGYSIFQDTMADMTFPQIVQAAQDRAVVLWGLGVIEQHGPHLPLATDVYMPAALLRRVRARLKERGVPSIIMPPFYWGVNHVSALFPGTFEVRPAIMIEMMVDLIKSLKKDSFSTLFCVSGHGDALHNRTILEGVRRGADESGIEAYFVGAPSFFSRLDIAHDDPNVLPTVQEVDRTAKFLDVHAGEFETSSMWAICPELVRTDILSSLKSTDFVLDDLMEWRKGREHAIRKTPQGYLGDPASANPELGARIFDEHARIVAETIAAKVGA